MTVFYKELIGLFVSFVVVFLSFGFFVCHLRSLNTPPQYHDGKVMIYGNTIQESIDKHYKRTAHGAWSAGLEMPVAETILNSQLLSKITFFDIFLLVLLWVGGIFMTGFSKGLLKQLCRK